MRIFYLPANLGKVVFILITCLAISCSKSSDDSPTTDPTDDTGGGDDTVDPDEADLVTYVASITKNLTFFDDTDNPEPNTFNFAYNDEARMTGFTSSNAQFVFEYNSLGQISKVLVNSLTGENVEVWDHTYNDAGLLISTVYSSPSPDFSRDITYTYDDLDRLIFVDDILESGIFSSDTDYFYTYSDDTRNPERLGRTYEDSSGGSSMDLFRFEYGSQDNVLFYGDAFIAASYPFVRFSSIIPNITDQLIENIVRLDPVDGSDVALVWERIYEFDADGNITQRSSDFYQDDGTIRYNQTEDFTYIEL